MAGISYFLSGVLNWLCFPSYLQQIVTQFHLQLHVCISAALVIPSINALLTL